LLGAIMGSFLATLTMRWPAGESVVAGRSRCDGCERTLAWFELVPLLSFVVLRGRCRRCGAAIDWIHPTTELAAGVIGALAFLVAPLAQGLAGAMFGWILLALAILDFRHLWLPDRLTLPLVLLGLGVSALPGGVTPLASAIGAGAGFLTLYAIGLLYRVTRGRDGLGGGDAKLLAAIGAWLGWYLLPLVLLLASVAGLAAVAVSAARGNRISASDRLPLGTLLAIAAWPLWLARAPLTAYMGL